ncbi:DUF2721 domain-containing protein [Craterilacuibacter sinensis]|uniref:DUF2721 domain-containing protein n=1 Tax=Craterilacuibacter sinensis TaxID=2686017 RepID=A0A845BNJ3_9NEIS|nr:DUF2721 domain-containing protein [Craterilacuibacter sinensis]MXR35866.1 DUF2721 domain-containing protein [Craterilacuibacter sinensis]
MMELATPGFLFPALCMLLIAYTNRFLALAGIIRNLCKDYQSTRDRKIILQISSLRRRLRLTQYMQLCGMAALLGCVLALLGILMQWSHYAYYSFSASISLMLVSLLLSLYELKLSSDALNILLAGLLEQRG